MNLAGVEPPSEGCLGFWFLGAPEGCSRSAGERVHPAARLGPSGCCFPALPRCTATETGQHWWLPVCCFWSQHCSHAHWLFKLSHVWISKKWTKISAASARVDQDGESTYVCLMLFKELKAAAWKTCVWNLHLFFDTAWTRQNIHNKVFVRCLCVHIFFTCWFVGSFSQDKI